MGLTLPNYARWFFKIFFFFNFNIWWDSISMYLKFFCYFYLKISDKAIVDKNK